MPASTKYPSKSHHKTIGRKPLPRALPLEVLHGLGEGVVQVDGRCSVVYANPPAAGLLSKDEADLAGRPLDTLFSPSSMEIIRRIIEAPDPMDPDIPLPAVLIDGRTIHIGFLAHAFDRDETKDGAFLKLCMGPDAGGVEHSVTKKGRELSLISDLLQRARASQPEETLFRFLLERSIEILDAEAGTVALLEVENGEQGHLAFRYASGERAESVCGIYIPKGQGIIGWCVSNDKPAIVNNIDKDQRFLPWVDRMSGFETRSILCLPIRSEGEVFGAIEIINKRKGDFTQEDIDLLRFLVDAATFNMKTVLAQQRLLGQRDYYSGIMDSLSEGVMIMGPDYRVSDVNQFFVMFLNRERSEIIGETCHRLLKRLETPCEDCLLKRFGIFEEGKDFSTIIELPGPEGENTLFRVSGTPLEIRDEIIASAVLTFHDVTRIQRLHNYLNASASVASLLLKGQNVREMAVETLEIMGRAAGASRCYWFENRQDENHDVHMALQAEWCAPGIESLRGQEAFKERAYADGLSRWLEEFSKGNFISGRAEDFPPEERRVLDAMKARTILMIPLFILDKLAGLIGFDGCTSNHPWEEAEVNLLQTTASFLSKAFEHDQSLAALRESEARYRDIYENIYDSWCLHDMDGRFLEVNPAVERTVGYSEKELLTMSIRDIIPPRYQYQFDRYLREVREKGVSEGLIRIRAKNGEERVLEYRNWLVKSRDGTPAYRGLVRDITERMNLKRQLKHAQRMESIGTLASGISHNFRNLLTGIMTNIQLIHMKYSHIPELNQYASEILKLTRAGSDLIRNLLQFSHKGPTESKAVINLSDVLAETLTIISRSFDKRVTIQTSWPELLPVYTERASLSQVFMNLCMNARDAMPAGGTLSITADQIENRISVRIRDTGVGMDKATLKKVYDPFFTTKTPGKGTGLGLSMAYGIVKQNEGEILIESEPGLGTTFEILLPVPENTTETVVPPASELVQGNGQMVLIADDDETILQPMIELLEGLGYRAGAVSNGHQAVEAYVSQQPDAILLDRSMPGMDGLDAARRILEHDPDACIILISGYDEDGPEGIDHPARGSIKGYIPKPFDIGELSKVLAEVLKS
ncbi:MAG: PAS domain S-box protein [Desulfatiglandales bacterium]